MQQILSLSLPASWQELSDKQLRFVFHLLATEHSVSQVMALCLLRWAQIHVKGREGSLFIVCHNGEEFVISAHDVAVASQSLAWLGTVPSFPIRLSRIGRHRPVRADLQGVSFGDFLILDNLYQGYLQTQRRDLLQEMAAILYQSGRVRLNRDEEVCVFYWFSSVKQMFARMYGHFFHSLSGEESSPTMPTPQQLQESMDTQIRALTGGDITKEHDVLEMDCWRALTELDAKARDYEEMKKEMKK